MLKTRMYVCESCGRHTDELVEDPPPATMPCTCGGVAELTMAMPPVKTIVRGNSDYNERERERLEKRSHEHWLREGRDEAIERQRAIDKKAGL